MIYAFIGAGVMFWVSTVIIDRWGYRRKTIPMVTVCEKLANLRREFRGAQVGTTLPVEMVLQALPPPITLEVGNRLYGCTIVFVSDLDVYFVYP